MNEPTMVYECGGCGHYHPINFRGDCREDRYRWAFDAPEMMGALIAFTEYDALKAEEEGWNIYSATERAAHGIEPYPAD